MKIAGIIITVIGVVAVAIFGIQAINDSESFNLLGIDVAVSKADWTPLIVSAMVLTLGLFLIVTGKKK